MVNILYNVYDGLPSEIEGALKYRKIIEERG